MTPAELLRYLVEVLDGLGLPYMVGGSHAAMYYGEPRLTRDVELNIRRPLTREHNKLIDRLLEAARKIFSEED